MAITITEEGTRIGEASQAELNRAAAEDLERIEEEAKREAEEYVAAVDGDGEGSEDDEKKSVEAAGTAFDFDQAEEETEQIENESQERAERPPYGPQGW